MTQPNSLKSFEVSAIECRDTNDLQVFYGII